MFEVNASRWAFDSDLQVIHAEVKLTADEHVLIEEPLCVDVGLPAFLYSALCDTEPDRWAPAEEWRHMPFFICGCGDPECRGFSFRVRHREAGRVELTLLEERQGRSPRELESYSIEEAVYRHQALQLGKAYLQFIEGLDYKPYFADTVTVVSELVRELER